MSKLRPLVRPERVLILHHVEPMWEDNYCFMRDLLLPDIVTHIRRAKYDTVILTRLEDYRFPEEYCGYGLDELVHEVHEWSYAWEPGDTELPEEDLIRVSTAHEWAYLYQWIKDLKGSFVSLAGGHRIACLRDLEESLTHLKIKWRRIEHLVYG